MKNDYLAELIITGNFSANTMDSFEKKHAKIENRKEWSILYKQTGETVYHCNKKQYMSNANTILIAPRGCNYEWNLLQPGLFTHVSFSSPMEYGDFFSFRISDANCFIQLFSEITEILQAHSENSQIECMIRTYSLLRLLLDNDKKTYMPQIQKKRLQPAIIYMSNHINEHLTNEVLAERLGISVSHFRRLFSETYQTSPMAYFHKLRITKAKELLKSEFGSISSIATALGYANIYDFSRAFKNETGKAPSSYLKEHQEKNCAK